MSKILRKTKRWYIEKEQFKLKNGVVIPRFVAHVKHPYDYGHKITSGFMTYSEAVKWASSMANLKKNLKKPSRRREK